MSKFKSYTKDQIDKLLSQFLINSWSYSKTTTFSRNPKAFEMEYVYGYRSKSSSTTIAGNAYHDALEMYFKAMKDNTELPGLVEMTKIAFNYIEELEPNFWKLQKTVPTIEECIQKANKTTTSLIENFLKETSIYTDEVLEVLDVEVYGTEFVTVNGVDVPLPLNYRIDLVLKLKNGKVVVADHKSKDKYTGEDSIALSIGKQAMTYAIGYEATTGIKVDEVWFMENKYSQNRDGSPQIAKFVVDISNPDIRKYYEALLYESLRGLIQAVNDPDYVYIMNDSDNLIDLAEMYQFWQKTLIAEIEEFNVDPDKKELIAKRLKKIKDSGIKTINPNIIRDFQKCASQFIQYDYQNSNMTKEEKIQHVLRTFGIVIEVGHVFDGYSSDTYLISVTAGTKISNIQSRKLEIANALDVSGVRILDQLKVHEGKAYVGLEVSKKRQKDLLFDKNDLVEMKIPIGKDNFGNTIYWDLKNSSTPHMLVCGGTGSGKTVNIISTIEYCLLAGVKEIEILDLKFEFKNKKFSKKVSVYNEIEDIERKAEELVAEMNQRIKDGYSEEKVIVLDEFADAYLMMSNGKALDIMEEVQDGFYAPRKMKGPFGEYMSDPIPKMKMKAVGRRNTLEENIQSLLQKGRSSGYHLILATQRADAKTISGSAKVNLPVQLCFRVQKAIDSRVVIDSEGAETLAGGGDFLIKSPEYLEIIRGQAYYHS